MAGKGLQVLSGAGYLIKKLFLLMLIASVAFAWTDSGDCTGTYNWTGEALDWDNKVTMQAWDQNDLTWTGFTTNGTYANYNTSINFTDNLWSNTTVGAYCGSASENCPPLWFNHTIDNGDYEVYMYIASYSSAPQHCDIEIEGTQSDWNTIMPYTDIAVYYWDIGDFTVSDGSLDILLDDTNDGLCQPRGFRIVPINDTSCYKQNATAVTVNLEDATLINGYDGSPYDNSTDNLWGVNTGGTPDYYYCAGNAENCSGYSTQTLNTGAQYVEFEVYNLPAINNTYNFSVEFAEFVSKTTDDEGSEGFFWRAFGVTDSSDTTIDAIVRDHQDAGVWTVVDSIRSYSMIEESSPTVNIIYPLNTSYAFPAPEYVTFNFTHDAESEANCSLWENGTVQNSTLNLANNTNFDLYWSDLSNATYNIIIECMVWNGAQTYNGSMDVTFTRSSAGLVTPQAPANNTHTNTSSTSFMFAPTNYTAEIDGCWLFVNGTNKTGNTTEITGGGSSETIDWSFDAGEGLYQWFASCLMDSQLLNSTTWDLIYDSTAPVLSIDSPWDGQIFNLSSSNNLDIEATDTYMFNLTCEVNDSDGTLIDTYFNESGANPSTLVDEFTSALPAGLNYQLTCSASDSHTDQDWKADEIEADIGQLRIKKNEKTIRFNYAWAETVQYEELFDRVKWGVNAPVNESTKQVKVKFNVESDCPIHIIEPSEYAGHFVTCDSWTDFDDLVKEGFTVRVVQEDTNIVEVEIEKDDVEGSWVYLDPYTGGMSVTTTSVNFSIVDFLPMNYNYQAGTNTDWERTCQNTTHQKLYVQRTVCNAEDKCMTVNETEYRYCEYDCDSGECNPPDWEVTVWVMIAVVLLALVMLAYGISR